MAEMFAKTFWYIFLGVKGSPHEEIKRCLTDINQCLTDIFKI